jgi:hypothetical protein
MKKTLPEVQQEIQRIIKDYPELARRQTELAQAGYSDMKYVYVKQSGGIGSTRYMKKKKVYRIQIDHTELKKSYPAAWVTDVPDENIDWFIELPF